MSPASEFAFVLLFVVLLNASCVMDRMLLGMIGILDLDDIAYDDVSSVDQFITDDSDVCLLDWTMNPLIASQYSTPPCLRRRWNGPASISGGVENGDIK